MRQLEFHFGEVDARGADTVLVTGAVQSNLVRIAAAAARKLGMAVHIQLEERVADGGETYRTSGNLLLDRVLGATLHPFPEGEDEAAADAAMERRAAALAAEGRRPYVIHSAPGHPPLGGLGYVLAAEEIAEQASGTGFDAVVCASGSALTHAGMLVGLRALGERVPVLGICVRRDAASQAARVAQVASALAAMIDCPDAFDAGGVEVSDAVLAPGYGRLNEAAREAMEMAARHEGLLLDPGLHGQGDGGSDHPCAFGADRSGQPGAVRPHRRPAGALRLCRQPRVLALGSAGRTRALRGRGARRRVRGSAERPGRRAALPAPLPGSSSGTPAARAAAARRRW